MSIERLTSVLNRNRINYEVVDHPSAYTAQEIAANAHVSGKEFAKTVIVKLDGTMAMVVLPASRKVDFEMFNEVFPHTDVELAKEAEFADYFVTCEAGSMPPFGFLYGMHVYVAPELAEDEEIYFNAESHTKLVKMRYKDWEDLVQPQKLLFATMV